MGSGTNLNKSFSILAFSDKEIMDRASKLGVSLGSNPVVSAALIKKSELDRSLTILQNNLRENYDEHSNSLILNRASCLTEDLEDDDISRNIEDRDDFFIVSERVTRTRKKKDYSNLNRRRSAIIKIQNKNRDA